MCAQETDKGHRIPARALEGRCLGRGGRGWMSCQPQLLGTVTLGRMPGSITDNACLGWKPGSRKLCRAWMVGHRLCGTAEGRKLVAQLGQAASGLLHSLYSAETVCIRDCRNCSSQSRARHWNPSLRGGKGGVTAGFDLVAQGPSPEQLHKG